MIEIRLKLIVVSKLFFNIFRLTKIKCINKFNWSIVYLKSTTLWNLFKINNSNKYKIKTFRIIKESNSLKFLVWRINYLKTQFLTKVLVQLKDVTMNKCSCGIWRISNQQLSNKFLYQAIKILKGHFLVLKNPNNDLNIWRS